MNDQDLLTIGKEGSWLRWGWAWMTFGLMAFGHVLITSWYWEWLAEIISKYAIILRGLPRVGGAILATITFAAGVAPILLALLVPHSAPRYRKAIARGLAIGLALSMVWASGKLMPLSSDAAAVPLTIIPLIWMTYMSLWSDKEPT